MLTKDLHVLPYFHGNRSPRADPTLVGSISGLTLNYHNLPTLYLSVLQALCHGTRHIMDEMREKGYDIDLIFLTGMESTFSLTIDRWVYKEQNLSSATSRYHELFRLSAERRECRAARRRYYRSRRRQR